MWERIGGWFRLLWDAVEKLSEQSAAIEELQDSNQKLVRAVDHLFEQNKQLRRELEQGLNHERELRESNLREIRLEQQSRLEQQLRIAEELRRLPPTSE